MPAPDPAKRRQIEPKSRLPILMLLCLLNSPIFLSACISPRRTPDLERVFAEARLRTGKRPVVVIPGILGSQLIDKRTGRVVWPSVLRASDDDSGLPMDPDLAASRDNLVHGKIVETLRLARVLPEVYVYRDLLEALRRYGGYREADWDNPGDNGDRDSFYVFAYDWRRDNVENARELSRRLETLKRKLNRPDLRFNLLAHSMGGLIARYAAMYGDTDLPSDDLSIHPTWVGAAHINKIIMLGVPNQGLADAFATIIDGYSITEGLRRRVPLLNKLSAEDAVQTPAVFQLLPHTKMTRFLDEDLNPMALDLFDAAVWKQYGWSPINDAEFRRRYMSGKGVATGPQSSNTSLQTLDAYLDAVLRRAKRFHEALDAPSEGDPPVTMLAIGGDCEETLDAPIILRDTKRNRWITLIRPRDYRTSKGRRISKQQATAAMYVPGDGRVTRRSLLGEDLPGKRHTTNSFDSPLALHYAVFGCDLHGQLQKNKTLQDNALTALVSEAMK